MSDTKRKVFIVGGATPAFIQMFTAKGFHVMDNHKEKITDADLVQFTGGSDVNPALYGEAKHPSTFFNDFRDTTESRVFDTCVANKIPMAGICRGGQFLNVMNGGRMYQHVDGHGISGHHAMVDLHDGSITQVTSTHHQMMRPGRKAILLAIASNISTRKEHCDSAGGVIVDHEDLVDVEVVMYKYNKCLCYQPHPEYGHAGNECTASYFKYVEQLLAL